jgi:hypothetical protein
MESTVPLPSSGILFKPEASPPASSKSRLQGLSVRFPDRVSYFLLLCTIPVVLTKFRLFSSRQVARQAAPKCAKITPRRVAQSNFNKIHNYLILLIIL